MSQKSGWISQLLEHPLVYQAWQKPFAHQKLKPFFRLNQLPPNVTLLDVGCGPGTHAPYFKTSRYLGVDFNPQYVAYANRVHKKNFIVGDVTQAQTFNHASIQPPFDHIMANSLLHHIDDSGCRFLLEKLETLLAPDGKIHIFDLVLPTQPGWTRWMAQRDRGEHPRPLKDWRALFGAHFKEEVFEPYLLRFLGLPFWRMVYFRGAKKT